MTQKWLRVSGVPGCEGSGKIFPAEAKYLIPREAKHPGKTFDPAHASAREAIWFDRVWIPPTFSILPFHMHRGSHACMQPIGARD